MIASCDTSPSWRSAKILDWLYSKRDHLGRYKNDIPLLINLNVLVDSVSVYPNLFSKI